MEIYRTESFEIGKLNEFMSEYAERLKIGDMIRFDMTDGPATAMAVKQEEDGMIFCFVDCLADEHRLHKPGNYPGWEGCELRGVLNGEILDRFPAELREHMAPFENGDLLRIPTEMEMFGENECGEEEEGVEQFEPMKDRRNRIANNGHKTDRWAWYWLQNRTVHSATWAAIVGGAGLAGRGGAPRTSVRCARFSRSGIYKICRPEGGKWRVSIWARNQFCLTLKWSGRSWMEARRRPEG